MDGILSAAAILHIHPKARLSFVPSSSAAVDVIRRDIAQPLIVADLGLTPGLVRAMNDKSKTRQSVLFLDHHQQSTRGIDALSLAVTPVVAEGASATSVVLDHFGIEHLSHLGAVADVVEFCSSPHLSATRRSVGRKRIAREARAMDYAWRYQVEDDRFRVRSAQALSLGMWPTEVPEVQRRFLIVHNENRYERALERAHERMRIRGHVAILDFGKRKPSLLGFGTRALSAAAQQQGAQVAVLVNRRSRLSSVSLRGFEPEPNLGLFVEQFTQRHGLVGGGHPSSAGARIHTRDLPLFLDSLVELAAA